jgi:DNA modification methylase
MVVRGDALKIPLRDQTAQCVVTSPPYFQLRDYQCGERQIGLESTPEAYIDALVEVFREVRRVLRRDGVIWLVLGDSYWGANWRGTRGLGAKQARSAPRGCAAAQRSLGPQRHRHHTLKRKDSIGIPWRVALALQADGWHLRADVIWAKPNPMPEPVRDRPTRSHEYVFYAEVRIMPRSFRPSLDAVPPSGVDIGIIRGENG